MSNQAQMRRGCLSQHLLRTSLPLLWAIPLLLVVTAPSCGNDDLKRVGRVLNEAVRSIQILQSTVIDAHDAGLMEKASADEVVSLTVRVAIAIGRANTLTRNFSRLEPDQRNNLLQILDPVLIALKEGVLDSELSGIADESLRASIKLGFESVITAIETVKLIIGVT